jgi:uncharacterized protein YndB with AHSA1/START domain
MSDFPAIAFATVDAPRRAIWRALTDPAAIKQYMFGADVETDWKEGSSIVWKGEWDGKRYEDKGKIVAVRPEQLITYSHFSPLSGLPDTPENYHLITIELDSEGKKTHISLTQDNNPSPEARNHSEKNWTSVLEGLKKFVESQEA